MRPPGSVSIKVVYLLGIYITVVFMLSYLILLILF